MTQLNLPQVTLISASSINLDATVQAMEACQRHIRFANSKLLTHCKLTINLPSIEVISAPKLEDSVQYSAFMLAELANYVETSHCLVVQWDGHVVNSARWNPAFLEYDYIGALWPQFADGENVGNGGFSLRSRRLLEACRSPQFRPSHPEDLAIGRGNRAWLEAQGLRFASREVADTFSVERAGSINSSFGFHGVWHMPQLLGADKFWELYRGLEDRTTIYHDRRQIMREMAGQPHGLRRCLRMGWDSLWKD